MKYWRISGPDELQQEAQVADDRVVAQDRVPRLPQVVTIPDPIPPEATS
jgi:hypothetical protein